MSRWGILLMLILVAVLGGGVYRYQTAATSVQAEAVRRATIREYVDERGKTRLRHTYDITMPYAGRIEGIVLREGDPVKAGQVVAQVDRVDLANEVAEAQAAVDRLEASIAENNDHSVERRTREQAMEFVKSMVHTVAAAEARKTAGAKRLEYAQNFFARMRDLYQKNAKTLEEVELAEVELVERQVDYKQDDLVWKSMQSVLAATQLLPEIIDEYIGHKAFTSAVLDKQRAEANVRLEEVLQRRERGTMRSPIDGVVLAKTTDDDQFLPAGAILLKIGRLSDLEVEVDILSQDATRIQLGASATIYGLAGGTESGGSVAGVVQRVYPEAFTKISSLGVEQQRVNVIVELSEDALQTMQALHVGAGYRVRVRVFTKQRKDALIVSRSALFRSSDGGWQVFAIRGGKARIQDVTVGLMNDEHVELTSGLEENETVILAPENNLQDGTRVRAET
jgi:HlyD family secretion protein